MFSTVTMRREIKVWHPTCAHGVTDASSPEHENTLRIRQPGGRFLPSLERVGETLVYCHVEGEAGLTISPRHSRAARVYFLCILYSRTRQVMTCQMYIQ